MGKPKKKGKSKGKGKKGKLPKRLQGPGFKKASPDERCPEVVMKETITTETIVSPSTPLLPETLSALTPLESAEIGKRFLECNDALGQPVRLELDGLGAPPDGYVVTDGKEEPAEYLVRHAVYVLLQHIGVDPKDPAVVDTPKRVAKALKEMTAGYQEDPCEILGRVFEASEYDEVIILKGIHFTSLCEHHLLPFTGTADVGYLPGPKGKVVGLSKLARLVECFARRLQMQERLTSEISSSLMSCLEAKGAAVVVRAHHSCMGCRGVRKPTAEMVTSSMLGVFRDNPAARSEFLSLCGGK